MRPRAFFQVSLRAGALKGALAGGILLFGPRSRSPSEVSVSQAALASPVAAPAVRFPALRAPAYRWYWLTSTISMVADNIEHVIGYWLLWELTHSPFWLGYAVFSHWAPFILFSLHAGAWADRFDNRKLIQFSQGLYMVCSGGLAILYLTGQLQLWHMII